MASKEEKDNLSPSGKEALDDLEPVAEEEAALELDSSGPLHLQSPEDRIMTGAVSEEHAEEQEKVLADLPEDFSGDVTESGRPLVREREEKDHDYSNYPPPRSEEGAEMAGPAEQKAVLYTDGESGQADQLLERAYKVPEKLKSSDEDDKEAGKESDSKAEGSDLDELRDMIDEKKSNKKSSSKKSE